MQGPLVGREVREKFKTIVETISGELSGLLRSCGTEEISQESMTGAYRKFVDDVFGSDGMLLSLTKHQFTVRPVDFMRHLVSTNKADATPGTDFMDSCDPRGRAAFLDRHRSLAQLFADLPWEGYSI